MVAPAGRSSHRALLTLSEQVPSDHRATTPAVIDHVALAQPQPDPLREHLE